MLARLAHVVSRHRRKVIFAWVALTLFGAFSASQVSKRWYQSFSIPGKSAYEANQRTLKTFGTGIRPPDVVVFHTTGDATKSTAIAAAMQRAAAAVPALPHQLVLLDARPHVRLEGPAHDLRGGLPAGAVDVLDDERRLGRSRGRRARAALRGPGRGHRARPARGGELAGRWQRQCARGSRDRRPGRDRDPPLRLRHAARGPDAGRGRGGRDPEHVHARLGAHLHHERLDHRPVPDRARRTGRRDRLCAADDLPLPRRAAGGRGRRDGARGDDDARRSLGHRLGLDRRRRSAVDGHPAAAVHPLDRHRRDADPCGLRARRDHADARRCSPC